MPWSLAGSNANVKIELRANRRTGRFRLESRCRRAHHHRSGLFRRPRRPCLRRRGSHAPAVPQQTRGQPRLPHVDRSASTRGPTRDASPPRGGGCAPRCPARVRTNSWPSSWIIRWRAASAADHHRRLSSRREVGRRARGDPWPPAAGEQRRRSRLGRWRRAPAPSSRGSSAGCGW